MIRLEAHWKLSTAHLRAAAHRLRNTALSDDVAQTQSLMLHPTPPCRSDESKATGWDSPGSLDQKKNFFKNNCWNNKIQS